MTNPTRTTQVATIRSPLPFEAKKAVNTEQAYKLDEKEQD